METTRGEVITASYARVSGLLFNSPLALTRDRAQQLASYLSARMRGTKPEAAITLSDMEREPITLAMEPDGIAVLSVRGTMTPKGSNMDTLSGLVGYDALRSAFEALATDAQVRGVVVAMDSPGGSVLGVDAAASSLSVLATTKPVYLVADHLTASAAYWIGAHATKLFVGDTSLVGAIGSFMIRQDSTVADEKAGEAFTVVANMARKGDGSPHKAMSEDELASMQAIVTHSDGLFFAAVSQARGLSVAAIKKLDGAALMGRAAVDAGLADAIGGVPEAIAALRTALPAPTITRGRAAARAEGRQDMSTEKPAEGASAEVIDITKDPRFAQAVEAAATAKAAEAVERDREIRGLCAIFGVAAEEAEKLVASGKPRADIYAALQEARVAADEASDIRGTHAGGAGKTRRETQDTEAAVTAEYADRRKIHAEARREYFGGRA